jgi:eukaryotic sulfide quinone oxidoreductase
MPMVSMVSAGICDLKYSSRPMKAVIPKNAKWIKDMAVQFEPTSNCVLTKNGNTIEYEFLVVAVGGQLNYEKVKAIFFYPKLFFINIVLVNIDSRFG